MPWTSEHLRWLFDAGEWLTAADGRAVDIWEFKLKKDDAVFSAWARHFRNHYCLGGKNPDNNATISSNAYDIWRLFHFAPTRP